MDLQAAFPCSQPVAGYDRQIDRTGLHAQILGPLYVGVAAHIVHARKTVVVICRVLGERQGG